jgi:leader peptidase (prepilin peptidase)/N-methyltransferase
MTAGLVVGAGLAGLAAGPWINLAADRVPSHRRVLGPGPACGRCVEARSLAANMVAAYSGLARGRCRFCGSRLPLRRGALAVLAAVSFALAARRFGLSPTLPALLAFFAGLLALAACDLEHRLLPRRILYPTTAVTAAALVVAAGATGKWPRLGVAAGCAAVAFGATAVIHLANPRWLGFGDVRLAGLIGLALGWLGPWPAWVGLVTADVAALATMGALVLLRQAGRGSALPFGVFLAGGAILAALV